jgi:hypothetical protein
LQIQIACRLNSQISGAPLRSAIKLAIRYATGGERRA